jgi:hypothetical protein
MLKILLLHVVEKAFRDTTPVEEKSKRARYCLELMVPRVTLVNDPPISTDPFGSNAMQRTSPLVIKVKVPSSDPSVFSLRMYCEVNCPPMSAFPSGSWAMQ